MRLPYLPLEWRKLILFVILLIFALLSQVLLLMPYKPDKYSLDGKTLLNCPFNDINKEASWIWKGSINNKYQIILVISSVRYTFLVDKGPPYFSRFLLPSLYLITTSSMVEKLNPTKLSVLFFHKKSDHHSCFAVK